MMLKSTFKINSQITSKNQVTIPKSVRKALNVSPAASRMGCRYLKKRPVIYVILW